MEPEFDITSDDEEMEHESYVQHVSEESLAGITADDEEIEAEYWQPPSEQELPRGCAGQTSVRSNRALNQAVSARIPATTTKYRQRANKKRFLNCSNTKTWIPD